MTQPVSLPPARRRRWRSWLVALLIFAGGVACGAAITVIVSARILQRAIQHPELAPARITARLTRKLDLTPSQADQVRGFIAARQHSLQQIRRQVQPQVQQELTELEAQISGVLTPEQRNKWEALLANLRENWLPGPPPTPESLGINR